MHTGILTIPETQEALRGVSRQTIYVLIREGRLQRVKLGRRAFITEASVDKLMRGIGVKKTA